MASLVHRYSGRVYLAANTQQRFGFAYTVNGQAVDPQPRSFNRFAVGHTGFGDIYTYLDLVEESMLFDAKNQPNHVGWNLLIKTRQGAADFIVSAIGVDQ
ncbi:hypothetical protein [Streptomyces sp. NPDC059080]|uniref:hypothetical protein n=1 Tax=Streptomyces sp. NPDC059080 TaxID=3346718 RepID=UPI00367AB5E2